MPDKSKRLCRTRADRQPQAHQHDGTHVTSPNRGYRAVLTFGYKAADSKAHTRLVNALCQVGWSYAGTTAVYVESDDLHPVERALEVLARYVSAPGQLSSLSLQVQHLGPERRPPGRHIHRHAIEYVMSCGLPSESSGPLVPGSEVGDQ